jgi:hypothetical protein
MNNYKWNIKSFAKNIDPNIAVQELTRIENIYGSLTPENILNASVSEDALFHPLFEWDDSEAARHYRLQQARVIINNIQVVTISNGEERFISNYEIITVEEGRAYKAIDSMSSDDIEQVKHRIIRDLNALKNKLSIYKQFEKLLIKLDEAIEIIKEV